MCTYTSAPMHAPVLVHACMHINTHILAYTYLTYTHTQPQGTQSIAGFVTEPWRTFSGHLPACVSSSTDQTRKGGLAPAQ